MKNSIRIFLCFFLFFVLVQGVQAAETYTFVTKWSPYRPAYDPNSARGQYGYNNNGPFGIAVDSSGNVYTADTWSNVIQKFNSNGAFLKEFCGIGAGDDRLFQGNVAPEGQLTNPYGVAVDTSGNVYVADTDNRRIQKFSPTGAFLGKWGKYGKMDGQFNDPHGVAVDASGNVYVVDRGNNRIQKFSSDGTFLGKWASEGSCGVAVDTSGNVYTVASGGFMKYSSDGTLLGKGGSEGSCGIAVDKSGNVYTVTKKGFMKYSSDGTLLGKGGSEGTGDGQFTEPFGIAVDTSGNVYVADWINARIQKFATSTVIPTTTTPTPVTSNKRIIIEAEDYNDANVKKMGATWDSAEEKCPTWRGNDWSGTGDYYLSNGGDTLTYLISSPATGNYVMWMRDWSDPNHATGDRQVKVTIDGATIGTFDAASSFNKGTTGYGWDKFTTVNLGAGSHTMKITKKDTTSSAAIIDELWFSSNVNEIPQGYNTHSEALCSVITKPGTTTPQITTVPWTQESPPLPYCTPPQCPSGKYVCLQKDGCPGGCGYSCGTITPQISIPPPTPSGIETIAILIAIGLGVVFFDNRRD